MEFGYRQSLIEGGGLGSLCSGYELGLAIHTICMPFSSCKD
jgi:hypothetical protein